MLIFKMPMAICKSESCKEKNGGHYVRWIPKGTYVYVCPRCHTSKHLEKEYNDD